LATFALAACGDDDDNDTTNGSDVTLSTDVDETTPTEDTTTEGTTGDDTIAPDDTTDGTTSSSGGGEVGERDEYLETAREQLPLEDEEIRGCVAEAIVNDDIYAAIQEAGLTVEAFASEGLDGLGVDEATAEQVGSDLAACGDLVAEVVADADETEQRCATDNITNDQISELLAFTFLGLDPSDEVQQANDAVEECIDAASPTTTG
jgi:hypothetical protein